MKWPLNPECSFRGAPFTFASMMLWELKFPRRNAINRIIVHLVQAAAANQSAMAVLTAENVPNNRSCFTIPILKEAFSVSENASFLPSQVGFFYRLTTGKLTAGTGIPNLSVLKHISTVCDFQRLFRILLNQ